MAKGPEIDDKKHGFVRADCEACGKADVWLTCNACKKADRFALDEKEVVCFCGARFAFATCTCGKPVPRARLTWVPFQKGPVALADWEVDWGQVVVTLFVIGAVGAIAAVLWYSRTL